MARPPIRATTTSSTTCALLRETFAARLARAFTPDDFATLFADPEQPSLFAPPIEDIQPALTPLLDPRDHLIHRRALGVSQLAKYRVVALEFGPRRVLH